MTNVSISWPPSCTAIFYVREADARDALGSSLRPCLNTFSFVVLLQPFHPCCITHSYNITTHDTHFVDRRKILQTYVYILTCIDKVTGGYFGGGGGGGGVFCGISLVGLLIRVTLTFHGVSVVEREDSTDRC